MDRYLLDPTVGEHHGAGKRFLNFARQLSEAGASVYFAVNVWNGDDRKTLEEFLAKLKSDGVIAGSILLHYSYSLKQGRIGALAMHPGLTDLILRKVRKTAVDSLLPFTKKHDITATIVSGRKLRFLGNELLRSVPTLFDWTDSMALYYWRELVTRVRKRNFAGLFGFLRDYQNNLIAEAYYGRRATLNTVVSPVDKSWLDRTNLKRSRNHVWMNGTHLKLSSPVTKIPKRIIFFRNYELCPKL